MSQNTLNRNPISLKAGFLKTGTRRSTRAGVLHLCPDLNYGDPARETVTLAVLTQRLGWRAMIASAGGGLVTEAERAAVKHTRVPLDQYGLLMNWRNRANLEGLLQRERPALIHAHGIGTVAIACKLSQHHRLPLIIDLTQPLPDQPATHRLIARITQTSCTVRVPTKMMFKHLTSTFKINPAIVAHVPPGIDLQAYNPAAISAERLHTLSRLWRVPDHGIVALVPTPIEPDMGHINFLKAMAQIKDEHIYAIMVGSDRKSPGLRYEIEQKIESLGLNGKVIMPDACPDWPAAFWLANVVVAPNSLLGGQNMELLGAQALGRPVIITAVGANEEMVQKDETAWILPPDNITALAKALREAAHLTTDQRINLADNTRFFIEDHFPQANWFNGMMELYEMLMYPVSDAKPTPPPKTRVA